MSRVPSLDGVSASIFIAIKFWRTLFAATKSKKVLRSVDKPHTTPRWGFGLNIYRHQVLANIVRRYKIKKGAQVGR